MLSTATVTHSTAHNFRGEPLKTYLHYFFGLLHKNQIWYSFNIQKYYEWLIKGLITNFSYLNASLNATLSIVLHPKSFISNVFFLFVQAEKIKEMRVRRWSELGQNQGGILTICLSSYLIWWQNTPNKTDQIALQFRLKYILFYQNDQIKSYSQLSLSNGIILPARLHL